MLLVAPGAKLKYLVHGGLCVTDGQPLTKCAPRNSAFYRGFLQSAANPEGTTYLVTDNPLQPRQCSPAGGHQAPSLPQHRPTL